MGTAGGSPRDLLIGRGVLLPLSEGLPFPLGTLIGAEELDWFHPVFTDNTPILLELSL